MTVLGPKGIICLDYLQYKTMVILTIEPVSIPITIQTGSDELPGYEPSRPALWRLISLANQH